MCYKGLDEKRRSLVNIIIGTRKNVLAELRKLDDSFDREVYTMAQKKAISQELREIAEIVSEKDSMMKRRKELENIEVNEYAKGNSLVEMTRQEVKKMLRKMKDGILAMGREHSIIEQELSEIELLVEEKDKLIRTKVQDFCPKKKSNPHTEKYFKICDSQEV